MKTRRITTALLSVCLLAGSIPAPATVSAKDSPFYGDVNCDSEIDIRDAVLLARSVGGDTTTVLDENARLNADVNGSGSTDAADLTELLRYLAKLIPALGQNTVKRPETVCLTEGLERIEQDNAELSDEFIQSQYNFTANLLKEAMSENTDQKNLMVSPTSAALALGMTANGAKGQTLSEMEQVLGSGISIDDLNKYYFNFINQLQNTENTSLESANSIWVIDRPESIKVPELFLQKADSFYHAEAFKSAFDHKTAEEINDWVSKNTHEMIDGIFDLSESEPIARGAVMCLINALAFEAKWERPYSYNRITDKVFHSINGHDIYAPMMSGEEYTYIETENATGFIKPYQDNNYSFAAILPDEDMTISEYVASLDGQAIAEIFTSTSQDTVITSMPKFEFDYSIKLNDSLIRMGMPTAFEPGIADLSGLDKLGKNNYIGDVLQKTYIAVDEAGTRAGAVTSLIIRKTTIQQYKYVTLDRPFLFMIIDNNSNLPVFIGTVTEPTEAEPVPDTGV